MAENALMAGLGAIFGKKKDSEKNKKDSEKKKKKKQQNEMSKIESAAKNRNAALEDIYSWGK